MEDLTLLHQRFCDFSLTFKGNSPKTIKGLKQCFGSYARHSHISVSTEITQISIEEWIFWGRENKKWSSKTIQNKLKYLSLFCDWMMNQGHLESNPVKKIPLPKLPKRIPKHLDLEDANRLLEWTQNFPFGYTFERSRAIAIIATFIYTGIRHEELRNLKLNHINFEGQSVLVESGKGMKDRYIPLSNSLQGHLNNYLKDRKRLKKSCPYFFTAMRQDSKMGTSVIPRLVKRLREKSGIHFYPHLLRHTFATLMLEGGCDIFSLSKMMGHSDIKTTTIYLSATTKLLRDQMKKHPLEFE